MMSEPFTLLSHCNCRAVCVMVTVMCKHMSRQAKSSAFNLFEGSKSTLHEDAWCDATTLKTRLALRNDSHDDVRPTYMQ